MAYEKLLIVINKTSEILTILNNFLFIFFLHNIYFVYILVPVYWIHLLDFYLNIKRRNW